MKVQPVYKFLFYFCNLNYFLNTFLNISFVYFGNYKSGLKTNHIDKQSISYKLLYQNQILFLIFKYLIKQIEYD